MLNPVKRWLTVLLVLALCAPAAAARAELPGIAEAGPESVADFYYTVSGSTFPPYFQRYRFYAEGGKRFFYHETRGGDHWPLAEEDITASGTAELDGETWSAFFRCLEGGSLKEREESVTDGDSGPWTYLYPAGGSGEGLEFSFASPGKRREFEALCAELAGEHILTLFRFHRGGSLVPQSREAVMAGGRYTVRENEEEPVPLDPARAAELRRIAAECGLESWDGFRGSNPDVLDGESFTLEMEFADGASVYASGENRFPEGYRDAAEQIELFFTEEKMSRLAGTYRCGQEGAGSLTVTLAADGAFAFSEGPSGASGGGAWSVYYDTVWVDGEEGGPDFTFRIAENALEYAADGPGFPSVSVADGTLFYRTGGEEEKE